MLRHSGKSRVWRWLFILLLAGVAVALWPRPKGQGAHVSGQADAGQPGVFYQGEAKHSPVLVRWDATAHSDLPAPALALRLRPTDPYAWWFTGGGDNRISSGEPQGPRELHLEVTVPGSDAFPQALPSPICEPGDKPFALCRTGRARVVLKRLPESSQEERMLLDVREMVPRIEFWTHEDRNSGRQRVVGWACPRGLSKTDFTPPQLEGLLTSAPDPRLACVKSGAWWQRLAPGLFGFAKHAAYFTATDAHFFYRARHAEVLYEDRHPNAAPWMDLMLLVTAWETLERARLEAIHEPEPMAELDEARIQTTVCAALVAEGTRWLDGAPILTGDAHKAWSRRNLPCRKAANSVIRLAELDPAAMEPLLAALAEGLLRLGDSQANALVEARLSALEKSSKGNAVHTFDALVDALPVLEGSGVYDTRIQQKLARVAQAWQLAQTLDPPAPFEKLRAVVQTLGRLKRSAQDNPGLVVLYEEWAQLLERRKAPRHYRLDALDSLADAQLSGGDFAALKLATDRLRDVYLNAHRPEPAYLGADTTATAAFNAVFFYRNYAFRQSAFAEVQADIAAVVARMEQEFGINSTIVRAARFHQDEVVRRQPAADGTPVGGGVSAEFGMFKCTDGSGTVSYRQHPCPQGSTASDVTAGGSEWALAHSTTGVGVHTNTKYETFLDAARIKTVGRFREVRFKRHIVQNDQACCETIYNVFFDCSGKAVAGPFVKDSGDSLLQIEDRIARDDGSVEFIAVGAHQTRHLLSGSAEPHVVAKVCGS